MSVWEILLSLSIGILGGIVSGVIVSRVFSIITMIYDQLRDFDKSINKLLSIHGMLTGIKQVTEFTYDSELKKEREMHEKGYKSESEYYSDHKEARWIDADVLIMNLLNECKKFCDELNKNMSEILVGENDIQLFYRKIHQILSDILDIKEASFDNLRQIESEMGRINAEYDDYKKRLRKVYFRKIITDKLFIVISIVVICSFVITAILFTKHI